MEFSFLNTTIQFESDNDNSTDTEESSSTSSYLYEYMPPLFHRSNSYDSDSSDDDTIESEKLIGRLSRKDKNEGETVLAIVSKGEKEAAPEEVPSNTVVDLMKRSGDLNEDWVLLNS